MQPEASKTRRLVVQGIVVFLGLGILVLGGAILLPEHNSEAGAEAPTASAPTTARTEHAAVPVTVAPVTIRPIQRKVEVVGTFFGFEEVTVATEVSGPVLAIHYDLGDVVRPGDVLLEIDPVDYQLAVEESRRELESELARLGLTAMPAEDFDVSQTPPVARAMSLESNSLSKYKRAQQLYRQNTLTEEELELAETDYKVAEANRRQAVLEARSILAMARQKQAKLATAVERLQETRFLVPTPTLKTANGPGLPDTGLDVEDVEYVVAERMVSEGELVSAVPPTPAFRLVIDKWLKLRAEVPERSVGEVRVGQTVEIATDAYPGKRFQGTVSRVSPTVDPVSRTFAIEVMVHNPDRLLRAGGFAQAAVLIRVDPHAKTVPTEAVLTFVGSTRVFVVRDGKAQTVPVTQGVSGPGWVEVIGELPADAQVILSGHAQLADGVPVRVRDVKR